MRRLRMTAFCGVATLTACAGCFAQDAAPVAFEVASVKRTPSKPGRSMMTMRGGPGTDDPARIAYTGIALKDLIAFAHGIRLCQLEGPAWLASERYDIVAKIPPGATFDRVRLMLQSLLSERFGLTTHIARKDLPSYALVVAKAPLKLQSAAGHASGTAPATPPRPPQLSLATVNGRTRIVGVAQSVGGLADLLSRQMDRPVVDSTGLSGTYDFTLEFAPLSGQAPITASPPDSALPPAESGPTVFAAIQEQLGLKLAARKIPTDILVIDRVSKEPAGN